MPNDKIVVRNGTFQIGPVTDNGSPFKPGSYILEIDSDMQQPAAVQEQIGSHGEYLRGPFVYVLEDGGKYELAQPPWNPNRSEAEAIFGFSIHVTQHLNIP